MEQHNSQAVEDSTLIASNLSEFIKAFYEINQKLNNTASNLVAEQKRLNDFAVLSTVQEMLAQYLSITGKYSNIVDSSFYKFMQANFDYTKYLTNFESYKRQYIVDDNNQYTYVPTKVKLSTFSDATTCI